MTLDEVVALLREARQYVGFCPFDPDLMNAVNDLRARIDTALAKHDTQKRNNVKNKRPAIQVPRGHDAKTCCCVDCCVSRSVR